LGTNKKSQYRVGLNSETPITCSLKAALLDRIFGTNVLNGFNSETVEVVIKEELYHSF